MLEEIGAYKNIKRFAGTSAGAMAAALFAVGYNSYEMEKFLRQDLSELFLGNSVTYFLITSRYNKTGQTGNEYFSELLLSENRAYMYIYPKLLLDKNRTTRA